MSETTTTTTTTTPMMSTKVATPTAKTAASTSAFSKQEIVSMGNAATYLSVTLNIVVSLAIFLGFPSADTFDDNWRKDGQCYTTHNIVGAGLTIDTKTLCCILLCSSAAVVWMIWYRNRETSKLNEQLMEGLPRMVQSNVSHGMGHYVTSLLGDSIPRVRPLSLFPADVGYTMVLLAFWPSTLRNAMPRLSLGSAFCIGLVMIAFQAAIDIEPHLQFSFTQAVVLLVQSMDKLTMPCERKLANPWTYLIHTLYYLPLYPMMWLETTECSNWVASMGGHTIYDFYLSVTPIALAVGLPYLEPGTASSVYANKKTL